MNQLKDTFLINKFFWFHSIVIGKLLDMILILLNLFRLVSWPNIWCILENVNMPLNKCILMLLDIVFYKYLLSLSFLTCCLKSIFPDWFCLHDLSIDISGVLMTTIIILIAISPVKSINISFIYLGIPC